MITIEIQPVIHRRQAWVFILLAGALATRFHYVSSPGP